MTPIELHREKVQAREGYFFELFQCNPWRPPDWRRQRIGLYQPPLLSQVREISRCDKTIEHAVRYLGCRTVHRARTDFPEVSAAFSIYDESPKLRAFMDAYIAADVPFEQMAAMLGVPLGKPVVELYEAIFFDVRDRLQNAAYMEDAVATYEKVNGPEDCALLRLGYEGFLRKCGADLITAYTTPAQASAEAKTILGQVAQEAVARRRARAALTGLGDSDAEGMGA